MEKVRRVSVTRKSDDSDLGFIQHSFCSASSINSEHSIYLRWVPFLSLPVKKASGGGRTGFSVPQSMFHALQEPLGRL